MNEHIKEMHVFLCEIKNCEVDDFDNIPMSDLIDKNRVLMMELVNE